MSRLKQSSILTFSVSVLILVALFLRTGMAQAASPQHSGTWQVVTSPNPSMNNNRLVGMAAASANDIWAVGEEGGAPSSGGSPLIEHWNGTAWDLVASPFYGEGNLNAVTTLSTTSAWAVGAIYEYGSNGEHSYILHWNGEAWERSLSPNPGTSFNTLNAVTALSANNIWAVGQYGNGTGSQTLIEHWDGATWSVVTSPSPGTTFNSLNAVAALSRDNIWAVGEYLNGGGLPSQTLIEHWNGTIWSIISGPGSSSTSLYNKLNAIAVVSDNSIWAVGSSTTSNYTDQTLIERWDGADWDIVPSPNIGSSALKGIVALSARDIWAVGYDWVSSSSNGTSGTLVEHWNGKTWSVVSSPNTGSGWNSLLAIARVPTSQTLWAAGTYSDSSNIYRTLVERWNGTTWRLVPSQNIDYTSPSLKAVAALSDRNAWAVGDYGFSTGAAQTIIEHWNGSAWSIIPSPNPGMIDNHLNGVAAISPRNVWAVGDSSNDTYTYQTLIEHWDGTSWSAITSPNATGSNTLNAITALSAGNIWAVGTHTASNALSQTLIEHWNGTGWSVLPSPNVPAHDNILTSVTAISANDVWAVGSARNGNAISSLIEHWDGTSWSIVSAPQVGTGNNALNGVIAISSHNLWAVGSTTTNGVRQALIEHWNGTSWKNVPAPNSGTGNNTLNGVVCIVSDNIWAVGDFYDSSTSSYRTLIEHWNGKSWSVLHSPNAGPGDNHLLGVTQIPGSHNAWAVGYSGFNPPTGYRTLTELYATPGNN